MECNSFYQHDEMDKEYNSFYQDDEAVKEREAIDGSYESWLVYVYIDGVKTQLSAPKKTELEAKLAYITSKFLYNKDNLNKGPIEISSFIDEFIENTNKSETIEESTKNTRITNFKNFKEYCSKIKLIYVRDINAKTVKNLVKEIISSNESTNRTTKKRLINTNMSIIRKIITKAKQVCIFERNYEAIKDIDDLLSNKEKKEDKNKCESSIRKYKKRDEYLEIFKESKNGLLLEIMIKTGVKFSEAICISKNNFIQENGNYYLIIQKELIYSNKKSPETEEGKFCFYLDKNSEKNEIGDMVFKVYNLNSSRKIPLSNETASHIGNYIEENINVIEAASIKYNLELIFLSSNATPILNNNLNSELASLCEKNNCNKITTNDLREIAIIHFIENGLTTTEIAHILGFRKTTEVDKIYKDISKYYLENHPERVQNLT